MPHRTGGRHGSRSEKPAYSPVPVRAFADPKLDGADFRVLGIIAAHDRLNSNGSGCYANHKRLAAKVGIHFVTFSKSTTKLGEEGYLVAEPHPLNKRLRVYRVVYSEEDRAVMEAREDVTVSPHANDHHASQTSIVSLQARGPAPIVSLGNPQATDSYAKSSVNIFCEAEKTSGETLGREEALEGNNLDTGSPTSARAFLAQTAEALSRRWPVDLDRMRRDLEDLFSALPPGHPDREWADELHQRVIERLSEAA